MVHFDFLKGVGVAVALAASGQRVFTAGVAARAEERKKLERLCRYISRPAMSEKRLALTPNGIVR